MAHEAYTLSDPIFHSSTLVAAKLLLESPGDISSSRPEERQPGGSTFAAIVQRSMLGALMYGIWFDRASVDEEVALAE